MWYIMTEIIFLSSYTRHVTLLLDKIITNDKNDNGLGDDNDRRKRRKGGNLIYYSDFVFCYVS